MCVWYMRCVESCAVRQPLVFIGSQLPFMECSLSFLVAPIRIFADEKRIRRTIFLCFLSLLFPIYCVRMEIVKNILKNVDDFEMMTVNLCYVSKRLFFFSCNKFFAFHHIFSLSPFTF